MTHAPRPIVLSATHADPPAICPACGASLALDRARCEPCRYERSLTRWTREPLPALARAARADGLSTVLVGALCLAPALVSLLVGASRRSWSAALFALVALSIAGLFLWLGVARLRAIGQPARWSFRDEGLEVSSEVNATTFALLVRGSREQRAFVELDPRWAALDASDPCLDALVAWHFGGERARDEASRAWFRRVARGALALARLASIGAIQLVERRSTAWSIREDGRRASNTARSISLVRGHSVVGDETAWETERALLAAFERVLGADEASVAPTAEARHYREAQLRAGSLREVAADEALTMLEAPLDGELEPRALPRVLDSLRERELRAMGEGASSEASRFDGLEPDRAAFADWIELFADRAEEPYDPYDDE